MPWLAALAALTALRLVVAAVTPLAPDEAYYWVWSRDLQGGYLDHPPMVALFIRAGTLMVGENVLGVRLMGPLSLALGSVLLALISGRWMQWVRLRPVRLRPGATAREEEAVGG